MRNVSNLLARLVIYGSTGAILGLVFWKVGDYNANDNDQEDDGGAAENANAQILLGAGLFLTQANLLLPFSQISTFYFDKKVFAAENALGLYQPWMYAVSQFLLEAWVLIMCGCIMTSVVVPMIGLSNPLWSNLESSLSLCAYFSVIGLVGNAIILLICMMCASQDLAFLVGSTYVVISLAASGGFVPFAVMPDWILWLEWTSVVKFGLQAYLQILFGGNPRVTLPHDLDLDRPDTITQNLWILIGMFGGIAGLSVGFLSLQKELR